MSYVTLRFTIYGPVHLLLYCRNYKFQNPQILANERLVGKPGTQTFQITFTYLKSIIKTLEKGVKCVES